MKPEIPQEVRKYFKRPLFILLTLLLLGAIWIMLTWNCVKYRAESGIKIDWAMIKDCSY